MDSSDKDTYTTAEQHAEQAKLRKLITQFAENAVKHGVDKDWANGWLRALGAEQIAGSNVYQINVTVTGDYGRTVTAASRAEAERIFNAHLSRIKGDGKITPQNCNDRIYHVAFGEQVVFASGPEDLDGTEPMPELTTDELKTQIRAMLMQGVAEQGWGYRWANASADHMGVPLLPKRKYHTVHVPVQVSAPVTITGFEGDDDSTLGEIAQRMLSKLPSVSGKPVEIGSTVEVLEAEASTDVVF
jgi:hypothetical protein